VESEESESLAKRVPPSIHLSIDLPLPPFFFSFHPIPHFFFPKAANNPLHLRTLRTPPPAKRRACDLASATTESEREREREDDERGGKRRGRRAVSGAIGTH